MKHDKVNGCKIKYLRTEERRDDKKNGVVRIFYCPKHKLEICRCGWEWGKHPTELGELNYLERFITQILNNE